MKKFLSIILTIALMLGLLLVPTTALSIEQGSDDFEFNVPDIFGVQTVLTFEVANGEATLVACEKTYDGKVPIPETYNGVPVTAIGRRAFRGCNLITEITIPNTVKTIGEEAFSGCSVTEIVVPESVSQMGMGVFVLCESLTSVVLPANITVIPEYTFLECAALETVTLNGEITEIGQDAFNGCVSLGGFSLPSSVTSIGEYAFWGCNLDEVVISNQFTALGERAFVEANVDTLRFFSVAQMERYQSGITATTVICLCENEDHAFSSPYDITCNECLYKEDVKNPVLLEKDAGSITLQAFDGYEYSIDGIVFQDSAVFGGLYVGKQYTLYQRVKAAGGEEASALSQGLSVALDSFAQTVIGGKSVEYIKIANNVTDKETYKLTFKYTATSDIPVSIMTAEDGEIFSNKGFVESENYAVKTLAATDILKQSEMFFTVDMYSLDGVSQGDALYLYVPNAGGLELSVTSVKLLNDKSGDSLIHNGGVSILKDMDTEDAQALRFYFSYDTETGNDVIIDGKAYTLKSRGFLLANGSLKRDSLVSKEALKTNSDIIDVMVTEFGSCWEVKDNNDGTSKIIFSNYVKGFKSENGSYNNTSRLYVKGYVVIEADGQEYTLYSAETNNTVSEIAAYIRTA